MSLIALIFACLSYEPIITGSFDNLMIKNRLTINGTLDTPNITSQNIISQNITNENLLNTAKLSCNDLTSISNIEGIREIIKKSDIESLNVKTINNPDISDIKSDINDFKTELSSLKQIIQNIISKDQEEDEEIKKIEKDIDNINNEIKNDSDQTEYIKMIIEQNC